MHPAASHHKIAIVIRGAVLAVLIATAAGIGATAARVPTTGLTAPGETRGDPVPLGDEGTIGPWSLRVIEVLAGPPATDLVVAAAPTNVPPRDGFTYVVIRLGIRNNGDQPLAIDGHDFAITGASGLVRRFVGVEPPAPALGAAVAPGETVEGWVVLGAPTDETSLLLLFDSLALPGAWADRLFALSADATIPAPTAPALPPNELGRDPAAPAPPNTPVVTTEWGIELLEVVRGAAVFDLVDYRTGALGVDDATGVSDGTEWLALRVRITNTRAGAETIAQPDVLPPGAFALVDESGAPLRDVATLTPPVPDAAGAYFAGAVREGWVSFELPTGYGGTTVRFLPFASDADPRFLRFGEPAPG